MRKTLVLFILTIFAIVFSGCSKTGPYMPVEKWLPQWNLLDHWILGNKRCLHSMTAYNGKIYIIGGQTTTGYFYPYYDMVYSDVIVSDDGFVWYQLTDNTAMGKLAGQSCVVFNDKMYIFAGNNSFSSVDGVNWQLLSSSTGVNAFESQALVYKNSIFLFGDKTIFSTVNGIDWDVLTLNAQIGNMNARSAAVFQDKIWMLGGDVASPSADVWTSENGVDWTAITRNASFGKKTRGLALVMDGKLSYLFGTDGTNTEQSTLIYSTTNGINWTSYGMPATFKARYAMAGCMTDDGTAYISGGTNYQSAYNIADIWRTMKY